MKVTRIAFSHRLNPGKYAELEEQARRLGRVRCDVWQRYGSVTGATLSDRQVRDRWLADGTHRQFGVLANAWKETVRDAMGDIAAYREAAKIPVKRAIHARASAAADRKRMFTALDKGAWAGDPFLARQMRRHWRRGHNRTRNQIVVRADKYNTRTDGNGRLWLAVPGLAARQTVRLHAATVPTSQRPCGAADVGVDKGYTEVLTDSDGKRHGVDLGVLLSAESDRLKERNRRRAKLRSIANAAERRDDKAKAARIRRNNLGMIKRDRRATKHRARVRTEIFTAVHRVVDKAATVVAEDLTKSFAGRKLLGRDMNRRLAGWTKGVTAEALKNVSERRGSVLVHVNAAYTSQACHRCSSLGNRSRDSLHCTMCGVVWKADVNAAINVLQRHGDPDITLHTPHKRVKQIVQERADRRRSRLPLPDSSPPCKRWAESE